MTTYEALSLMIKFGILVATIVLGCKLLTYKKEKDRYGNAVSSSHYSIMRRELTEPNIRNLSWLYYNT